MKLEVGFRRRGALPRRPNQPPFSGCPLSNFPSKNCFSFMKSLINTTENVLTYIYYVPAHLFVSSHILKNGFLNRLCDLPILCLLCLFFFLSPRWFYSNGPNLFLLTFQQFNYLWISYCFFVLILSTSLPKVKAGVNNVISFSCGSVELSYCLYNHYF